MVIMGNHADLDAPTPYTAIDTKHLSHIGVKIMSIEICAMNISNAHCVDLIMLLNIPA